MDESPIRMEIKEREETRMDRPEEGGVVEHVGTLAAGHFWDVPCAAKVLCSDDPFSKPGIQSY
jgi:hypothetical protein